METGGIPPTQRAAAERCGKLVAQGIVESKDAVEVLFATCLKAGYAGDQAGLRTRLWWLVRDAAEQWRIARIRAEYQILRDIAPILDARAASREIRQAAYDANCRLGEPFLMREVRDLIAEEMLVRLAAARQKKRAHGRR